MQINHTLIAFSNMNIGSGYFDLTSTKYDLKILILLEVLFNTYSRLLSHFDDFVVVVGFVNRRLKRDR